MFRGLFQTKNKTKNNIVMHTEDLDMQNIPQHIAIIMDGNGRWATARGLARTEVAVERDKRRHRQRAHEPPAEVFRLLFGCADDGFQPTKPRDRH